MSSEAFSALIFQAVIVDLTLVKGVPINPPVKMDIWPVPRSVATE